MTATDEQLRFFKARAERLKDERDQLRSDVAYQGSTILMLTTEKAALEKRIDELCAEVERMRGKLSESYDESYALEVENLRLSDENFKLQQHLEAEKQRNAKLRELVSGLEYCAQGHVCDCCPLYDPSGTNRRRCESLERELGIEVGE